MPGSPGSGRILGRRRSGRKMPREDHHHWGGAKVRQNTDSTIAVVWWAAKEQSKAKLIRYHELRGSSCGVPGEQDRAGPALGEMQTRDGWKIKFSRQLKKTAFSPSQCGGKKDASWRSLVWLKWLKWFLSSISRLHRWAFVSKNYDSHLGFFGETSPVLLN